MLVVSKDEAEHRWHGDLLSLDPSIRSPGVALFRHGALIACGRVKLPTELASMPWGERCQRVAMAVAGWWSDQDGARALTTVVYEKPQVYRGAKLEGDPDDLLGLVAVGAALVATMHAHAVHAGRRPAEVLTPEPDEWSGNLPKVKKGDARKSPRGRRVVTRLTSGENRLLSGQHDEMDGVGIGLWALGRFNPIKQFAGAV